jgi:MFS family permease
MFDNMPSMDDGASAWAARASLRFGERGTFVVAGASLVAIFAVAGTPIPLMADLRAGGIAPRAFAVASAAYFVSAVLGLLVLGRLSTHLGRRPVAIIALTAAALGCLLMAYAQSATGLALARAMQGLACGIAPGAIGAYVVDAAGPRRWQAALIAGSAPMMGLPLGAILAGAAAQAGAAAPHVFTASTVLLAVCVVGVVVAEETIAPRQGAVASLVPRVQLPRELWRPVAASAAVFVATWPLGGFYQAFGSIVAVDVLGSTSALAAGVIFASIMVLNPVGGIAASTLEPRRAFAVAMLMYAALLTTALAALRLGSPSLFVMAGLVGGALQGMAATCAMRMLLPRTRIEHRAGVLAAIYGIAYGSVAVAGLAAAPAAAEQPLDTVALIYGGIGIAAALAAPFLLPRNPIEQRKLT